MIVGKVTKDGDQWCVLHGDNLQVGIAGFGKTLPEAVADWIRAMQAAGFKMGDEGQVALCSGPPGKAMDELIASLEEDGPRPAPDKPEGCPWCVGFQELKDGLCPVHGVLADWEVCPNCGKVRRKEVGCTECGHERLWTCPQCEATNVATTMYCKGCGSARQR